ncbi:hypothetical protein [Streptomyces sp. CB03911]|uniref:hypothetical protein n=1 Tax=Streptomyces sp. CB03911 TaxID=1804758 RepID=UPI0009396779|nr:hypothetical protein [Streptomyces sp. CB03911]OKI16541.1 hypothetical protein A6A07_11055 [Streptomyces sp. CB03911]
MSKPHTPTKACPHRWCRPAHRTATALGGIAVVAIAVRQPWFLTILVALTVLTMATYAVITRKSMLDVATEDLPPIIPLMVRPGWANAAVSIDLLFLLTTPVMVLAVAQSQPGTYAADVAADGPIPILITVAVGVFHQLAHHFATRPARPKRVLAPVPD